MVSHHEAEAIMAETDSVLVEHMQRLFDSADKDKNGTLDQKEFVEENHTVSNNSRVCG